MNKREALKVLRAETMACWWSSPINPGPSDMSGALAEARGLVEDSLARAAFWASNVNPAQDYEIEWRNKLTEALDAYATWSENN